MRPFALLLLLPGLSLAAGLRAARPVRAQDVGGAVITSPVAGHVVAGRVAITGTAATGQFDRFELSFAFDPDPTGTWFYLAESRTPVIAGPLAEWDVSGITDSNYMLRLRVFNADGTYLEAIVRGIIVQNTPPTATAPPPTATPVAGVEPTLPASPEPTPLPTSLTGQLPAAATPLPSGPDESDASAAVPTEAMFRRLGLAFWAGVRWTVGAFALLGLYVGARHAYRHGVRRWLLRAWAAMQK